MWAPQREALETAGFRVLAPDLRGFGSRPLEPVAFSHVDDVRALLERRTAVVGCSFGGRVALDLAFAAPELVERLVLIAPALAGWEWSVEVEVGWAEEEKALERGDHEAAATACLELWLERGRPPEAVADEVRTLVREMTRRSYELQLPAAGDVEERWPEPPAIVRLGSLAQPTLVVVGAHDVPDMRAIAERIVAEAPDARLATVAGAAHLPSLERPDEVNSLLLDFLC